MLHGINRKQIAKGNQHRQKFFESPREIQRIVQWAFADKWNTIRLEQRPHPHGKLSVVRVKLLRFFLNPLFDALVFAFSRRVRVRFNLSCSFPSSSS